MKQLDATAAIYEHGDDGRFVGEVWMNPGVTSAAGNGMVVVHFAPGARTHWHSHSQGQFLYGVSGSGRTQSRGGAVRAIEPGDIVSVDAGEEHWHGAGAASPLVHVAVNLGGAPTWGSAVSDEDYGA